MEKSKIDRINELARAAKVRELEPTELEERTRLRKEYIAEYREQLRGTLENTYVQYSDGTRRKLRKKGEK